MRQIAPRLCSSGAGRSIAPAPVPWERLSAGSSGRGCNRSHLEQSAGAWPVVSSEHEVDQEVSTRVCMSRSLHGSTLKRHLAVIEALPRLQTSTPRQSGPTVHEASTGCCRRQESLASASPRSTGRCGPGRHPAEAEVSRWPREFLAGRAVLCVSVGCRQAQVRGTWSCCRAPGSQMQHAHGARRSRQPPGTVGTA